MESCFYKFFWNVFQFIKFLLLVVGLVSVYALICPRYIFPIYFESPTLVLNMSVLISLVVNAVHTMLFCCFHWQWFFFVCFFLMNVHCDLPERVTNCITLLIWPWCQISVKVLDSISLWLFPFLILGRNIVFQNL